MPGRTGGAAIRPGLAVATIAAAGRGNVDGEPIQGSKTENYALIVGSKTIIDSIEQGLHGMRRGETRQIPVQFPSTYQNRTLAGQEAVFHVTVNEIKERVLPELNDELAKEAGNVDTLDELKAKIDV